MIQGGRLLHRTETSNALRLQGIDGYFGEEFFMWMSVFRTTGNVNEGPHDTILDFEYGTTNSFCAMRLSLRSTI